MGVLKYKKKGESTWNTLSSMMIKAINVVQTKGSSTEDVMSQKAVTDELALKQDIADMSGYTTTSTTSSISGRVEDIEELIPTQATSGNQLADKSFVNSSIATSTATFRGTSATGLNESQFITWANSLTKDDNDYIFWNTEDASGNTQFKRYKYNGTQWVYEYTLNNSSFTSDQWAAINSNITSALTQNVSNLRDAAYKNVDTTIGSSSSSNVPTTDAVKAYVQSVMINPISDSNITTGQTFAVRDCVNVNGTMYLCDTATSEYPYENIISYNNALLLDDCGNLVVLDNTLSSDWHSF